MADKSLYARLGRLFSTGVIVRRVGAKQLKVSDTEHIQAVVSNRQRDRYSRIYAGAGYGGTSPAANYGLNLAYQSQRITLFRDYDIMDQDSIIHSALDIYADESTVKNETGRILNIECEDDQVKQILENLYYDILNVEFNLYMWIRSLCKYGDFFLFMEIAPQYGITNVMPLSVYDTMRLEGLDPKNPYYVCFETLGGSGQKQRLENFEVAHFRLIGDPNFLPYGKSMLEGARRVFRQLLLMEDAMLIHRIMRAPEKRLFKIDVGNIAPNDVDTHVAKIIDKTKKIPFQDPNTGEYNLRYNMQNLLEDYYLPVRGSDSGTNIETLGGLEWNGIEDIQYLLNRMLAALKIPKAFLGYEEGIAGKLTLASEDVRFARTIERLQRIVESELYKIGVVHLYSQGYTDETLINFQVTLTTPSTIYEQEKINLWKEKITLARDISDTKLLSSDWIYDQLFHMSRDEYEKERESIVEDVKRTFRYQQIEQGQSDPAKFGFPQDQPQPAPVEGAEPGAEGGAPGSQGGMGESEEPGRPHKGISYGQDSHPRGRDPLGFAERYHAIGDKQDREYRPKFPLSLEGKSMLNRMDVKNVTKNTQQLTFLTEALKNSDKGTFLDESVLEQTDEN